jgi:murein DD-endopeptidase MepM/ murein hydrolase activator NlpD
VRKGFQPGNGGDIGAGHYVVLRLDSGKTVKFFHLQQGSVFKVGQTYPEGTVVGRVGHTGGPIATHIHFEEEGAGGKALDPTAYFADLPNKQDVVG